MTKLKLNFNTTDMILYHLLQRFIYQYHSLFSRNKNHPSLDDLTALWFYNIFTNNEYFSKMPNSVLVDYEIKENKDLFIVVRAPLYYRSYHISLDKNINSCVKYNDNENSIPELNIFSIEYE